MKRILCWAVAAWVVAMPVFSAEPLTENDFKNLKKITYHQHIVYETYTQTDQGLASVFGYHFDTYLTPKTSFVLAIFGAVAGNRGGYGIAALGVAHRIPLAAKLFWDNRVITGSGGGGGLAAGGGFMWEVTTGLQYEVIRNGFLELKGGYLKFPTGSFETPVVQLGLSLQSQGVFLPY